MGHDWKDGESQVTMEFAFSVALFGLSIITGMLGIGVAVAAVPVLSMGLDSLVNQVHPLSLLLNGVTALFSAIAFARAGLIEVRPSVQLAIVATAFAPPGAFMARLVPESLIWIAYFAAVAFLCYRMLAMHSEGPARVNMRAILILAIPAAFISGFVGVGAGFLLVPLMIHFGFGIRQAAAINAVAVTPSSFAAALPHLGHMDLPLGFVLVLCGASAVGAMVGGALASSKVSPAVLRLVFLVTIIGTSAARALRMFT